MILILLTIFCLVMAIFLFRMAIKDATEMPESFDDLMLSGKIDRHMKILIKELKKKDELKKSI